MLLHFSINYIYSFIKTLNHQFCSDSICCQNCGVDVANGWTGVCHWDGGQFHDARAGHNSGQETQLCVWRSLRYWGCGFLLRFRNRYCTSYPQPINARHWLFSGPAISGSMMKNLGFSVIVCGLGLICFAFSPFLSYIKSIPDGRKEEDSKMEDFIEGEKTNFPYRPFPTESL